jgi:hypothetical protein
MSFPTETNHLRSWQTYTVRQPPVVAAAAAVYADPFRHSAEE